jgi:hypothetical protein
LHRDEFLHRRQRAVLDRLPHAEPGRDYRQGRLGRDALRNRQRLVELLARGHHLLHEVQAIRLVAAEFVGRQQVQHRVAEAGALGHAQRGATGGHDAALHFHLREAAVVGRDHDVGAEHEFDTDGEADALDGRHHRLGAAPVASGAEVVRLDQPFGYGLLAAPHVLGHGRQVEPGREMIAEGVQHADAQRGIVVEPRVGLGQLPEHRRRPAVALGRAVDADQQHVIEYLRIDAAFGRRGVGGGGHGRSPGRGIQDAEGAKVTQKSQKNTSEDFWFPFASSAQLLRPLRPAVRFQ